jgi:hypothetical protein
LIFTSYKLHLLLMKANIIIRISILPLDFSIFSNWISSILLEDEP